MITINGNNIFQSWGLSLVKDSFYNELMKFPDIKDRISNNWSDRNGIDVLLSAPKFKQRELTLQFFCDSYINYKTFIGFVKSNQKLSFFDDLTDKTYVFEYLDCSSFNYYLDYNMFAIKVRENNPIDNPISYLMTSSGIYLLTEINFKIQL